MSSFLGDINARSWVYGASGGLPSWSEPLLAGADRTFNVIFWYQLNETNDASNMQATYGGIQATSRRTVFSGSPSGPFTGIWFSWDENALTDPGFSGTAVAITGNSSPQFYYLPFFTQSTADTTIFLSFDPRVYPVTQQFMQATANGAAAMLEVCAWLHGVTANRNFGTDPAWTEHSNQDGGSPSFLCDLGMAWAPGGLTTFDLETLSGNDANPTLFMLGQFQTATAPGLTVVNVNGDDVMRRGNVETEQGDFRNVATCTDAANVTRVTLGGIEQGSIAEGTLEITPQGGGVYELRFPTVLDGPPDLTYGAYTDGLTFEDPGGDVDHTVNLEPPEGWAYNTVAGYAGRPPEQRNAFDNGTTTDGDQYEWQTTSSLGFTVVLNQNGTYTISGGGTNSQTFNLGIRETANGSVWGYYNQAVNTAPVVTDVDGATRLSGEVLATATNSLVNGNHFGHLKYDYDVWLTYDPGDGSAPDIEANPAVAQATGAWGMTQVEVLAWDFTGLDPAPYYAVVVGRKKPS